MNHVVKWYFFHKTKKYCLIVETNYVNSYYNEIVIKIYKLKKKIYYKIFSNASRLKNFKYVILDIYSSFVNFYAYS